MPTDCQEVTARCSLLDLFQCYREEYPDERAIERLLNHLRIEDYFNKLPTVREMQVLLAMHQHLSRKFIAKQLNISHHTVASHIQHLKNKLTAPNYFPVLMRLREIPLRVVKPVFSSTEVDKYPCL